MLTDVLMEPLLVTTPLGDSVVDRIVFRICPISFPNRFTLVDLVKLYMVDFMSSSGWIGCMLVLLP